MVNADQFEFLIADHGAALLQNRKRIGYWFWELHDIPPSMTDAVDYVDEIWVGSTFVKAAFETVTSKPVRHVPLPVAEPSPSTRSRASFRFPDDRFIFLATFDHFSVAERKNPYGVMRRVPASVRRERRADPRRQVDQRRAVVAEPRTAAARSRRAGGRPDLGRALGQGRPDGRDRRRRLPRVAPPVGGPRSALAEAMWLGKPVIATRYSGNLDFMDDDSSLLVDYTLVNVEHGEGVYPASAPWADPDLTQASAFMRAMAASPTDAAHLGQRGRQRMQQQPTLAETGRLIARLAAVDPPKGRTSWD